MHKYGNEFVLEAPMTHQNFSLFAVFVIAMNLTFCAGKTVEPVVESKSLMGIAKMESKSGSNVQGTIVLTQDKEDHVTLRIDLTGFEPNTTHAFHVHANGDCSDEGAASAGPHFNPAGNRHGGPDHENRHAGDMGNLEADEKGEVHTQRTNAMINLLPDNPNSAIGKSIIVHLGVDDFETQPTGNAGARITCGVIQKK